MDKQLKNKFEKWFENNEYQKIIDKILEIDEKDRDYEIIFQYIRALNNIGVMEKLLKR